MTEVSNVMPITPLVMRVTGGLKRKRDTRGRPRRTRTAEPSWRA